MSTAAVIADFFFCWERLSLLLPTTEYTHPLLTLLLVVLVHVRYHIWMTPLLRLQNRPLHLRPRLSCLLLVMMDE